MEAKPDSNSSISDHHQPRRFRRRIEIPAAAETLPEEIIEQILLNLPVKSLLKFTSVSKSWRSLISSNRFIEAHLEFSRKDPNFTHYRTISTLPPSRNGVNHCSLPSLFNGNGHATDAVDVDFPFDFSEKFVRVMGSCNGLVCIVTDEAHFFLLNPSTRKFKILPDVCDRLMNTIICAFKSGFGFVESTRDYKVLLVCCIFRRDSRTCETVVKVYSLTANSWKIIEFVVEDNHDFDVSGIFVSGKLHWCKIIQPEPNSTFDIVSFDLGSEVWGNVAQPPSCVESGFYVSQQSVGVFDGCLCVFYNHPRIGVDVWVMKEYGVSESWAKIVTVPDIHLPLMSNPSIHEPSLCVGPKGAILFVFESIVLIYNPSNNKFTCPEVKNFGGFLLSHVYYESLVPLV
ncbi:hypothetical protein ABFS83_06G173700 [Erythranthe nasuta]